MKTILFSVLFLVVMIASASTVRDDPPEFIPKLNAFEWVHRDWDQQQSIESYLFKICTVSATGILLVDGGKVVATATVSGPCDASLAVRMRACIAKLRAAVK